MRAEVVIYCKLDNVAPQNLERLFIKNTIEKMKYQATEDIIYLHIYKQKTSVQNI